MGAGAIVGIVICAIVVTLLVIGAVIFYPEAARTIKIHRMQDGLMHELSIALSILELAQEEADRRGATRVERIYLKVGWLSGVVPAALRGAYELAREQSPFAETRLEINEVPVRGFCPACDCVQPAISVVELCCQACGAPLHEPFSGRELEMTGMEIVV